LKKPKRRRPAPRRKQSRVPGVPAPRTSARETEADDRLAGIMRARLALMPPQVAADYRALACKDDPTVAEKAKLSVLEDTYAPSSRQLQAAIVTKSNVPGGTPLLRRDPPPQGPELTERPSWYA
jgi:hypothetical protein